MADGLGLSLGLQGQPQRYESIYMSGIKQVGAEKAAAKKAAIEDDELYRKYTNDIKIDPTFYHKSQSQRVKDAYVKYLGDTERARKEYPNTWSNNQAERRLELEQNLNKEENISKSIKDLYSIPEQERTRAQNELIKRLDSDKPITGFTDPLGSIVVAPDGTITTEYKLNPSRSNIQKEMASKINQTKFDYVSKIQQYGLGDNIVFEWQKRGLPKTKSEALALQRSQGLPETPPSIEALAEDALLSDRELVQNAQEYNRDALESLHERAIKENLTPEQVSQEGAKIVKDYLMGIGQGFMRQQEQQKIVRKPGSGLSFTFNSNGSGASNNNYELTFGSFDTEYTDTPVEKVKEVIKRGYTQEDFEKSPIYKELAEQGTVNLKVDENGIVTDATITRKSKLPTIVIKGKGGMKNTSPIDVTDEDGNLIRITPDQLEKHPTEGWKIVGRKAGTDETIKLPYTEENIAEFKIEPEELWSNHLKRSGKKSESQGKKPEVISTKEKERRIKNAAEKSSVLP